MRMSVVIPAGSTTSAWMAPENDKDSSGIVAICTPGTLTSTATVKFEVSLDASTALTLVDSVGVPITNVLTVNDYIALDPATHCGFPFFRLVVDSAEAEDRIFTVIVKEVS